MNPLFSGKGVRSNVEREGTKKPKPKRIRKECKCGYCGVKLTDQSIHKHNKEKHIGQKVYPVYPESQFGPGQRFDWAKKSVNMLEEGKQ